MNATKKTAKRRFKVEWCSSIPVDENGDAIYDAAVYQTQTFPTFGWASAFVRQLLSDRKDAFGSIRITLQAKE